MKLSFLGADRQVTGSCHQIEVNGKRLLIDCGMQQGSDETDNNALSFDAKNIDALLVTHAHIDHSGRVPLMVKNGFSGKIFATGATCDLLGIMLKDSAKIQEFEAEWKRRKGNRAGKPEQQALYGMEDAEKTLKLLQPCKYGEIVEISEGVKAEFIDAGHLLGSSSVRLTLTENGTVKTIVFSGDIGNKKQPIIRDPQYYHSADYVVMESTYGDRLHMEIPYKNAEIAAIFDSTFKNGGNVVIPCFAVGRTQELLYHIREIKEAGLVKSLPDFPVYVDSPLALEATKIFDKDLTGYADEETLTVLKNGFRPLHFSNLNLCQTTEESIALNDDPKPKVIISSSGMCEAGRIRHHLKHNLWRKECAVLFVGYQANGTLGRALREGAKEVKLFGETIAVKAAIHNFGGLSAHADKNGLLEWIGKFENKPNKVFVVHGEEEVSLSFTEAIKNIGFNAYCPNLKAEYDLIADALIREGVAAAVPAEPKVEYRISPVYEQLLHLGEEVMQTIRQNKGGANRDLVEFSAQLESLINRWGR